MVVVSSGCDCTYMTKFMVEQEIFGRLGNLVTFPSNELPKKHENGIEFSRDALILIDARASTYLSFERLNDRSSAAGTIDQNQSQAPWWMGQAVASQDICTSTLAQSNDIFHVQEVQNSDQIFAKCFQRWESKTSVRHGQIKWK